MFHVGLQSKRYFLYTSSTLAIVAASFLLNTPAHADDKDKIETKDQIETVVVTGTRFEVSAAPAKASLETMQPQTIINRDYIEDFVAPQSDYVSILAIVPSMTGTDVNGPGLSDGNVKNTLRGLPDGQYGMTYDNIPFGDTNGPSHHSVSYFPAPIIGSILVDRGPGNAGTLGAATYGGMIKLFSDTLSNDGGFKGSYSYGSFNTTLLNANAQSGAFGGSDSSHVMANIYFASADGALTLNDVKHTNFTLKADHNFGDKWKVTLFGTYNYLKEHLNDSNGATPAQINAYGKNFALQATDPKLPDYWAYNWTTKRTDMEYIRVQGDITDSLKIDDTAYSYFYTNHTFSARNILQTATDILADTGQGFGGKLAPIVNGVAQPNDVPGYKKLNRFRVWGDIMRASQDFDAGFLTGQLRAGIWWEGQITQRLRYDYDSTLCYNMGIDPWNQSVDSSACYDSSLAAVKTAVRTSKGFAEFEEHTSWYQYEPFAELELHPFDGLTVTPGVKYINWLHKTNSVVEPKLLKPLNAEFTTTRTLPFVEANYKITPSWSVYAQYAQGIYVPDISAFEQSKTVDQFPAAETTTNYQLGTVFYADNFTFDADVYLIPIDNNYVAQSCALTGGLSADTCFVNTGRAKYEGIEGEGTYAFDKGGMLEGLSVFVNGSIMYAKSNGLWLKQAPTFTAGGGLMYKHNGWKFSLIDKTVGSQYADNTENQNYKIGSYSNIDASVGYSYGYWEFTLSLNNVLNSRKKVSITENDKVYQTNRLNSTDQYFYQAPQSVLGTFKVHF